MVQYGQAPFDALLKQHSMLLEHHPMTENKTFCLSILPFHYKYTSRLYPIERPKYFYYVIHLFNAHVQSVAAFTGHIKIKKEINDDMKTHEKLYEQNEQDLNSDYSSSLSENSSSTIVNNEYITDNYTTVQDLIDKIKLEINPYLKKRGIDIKQKFRLLYSFGPQIRYLHSDEYLVEIDFVKSNPIKNSYVAPIRMEPDFSDEQKEMIKRNELKVSSKKKKK